MTNDQNEQLKNLLLTKRIKLANVVQQNNDIGIVTNTVEEGIQEARRIIRVKRKNP